MDLAIYGFIQTCQGVKYKIGYAKKSIREKDWTLALDECGIYPSKIGWDSEMVEYPFVFRNADNILIYIGNGYGLTGIGLASLNYDWF